MENAKNYRIKIITGQFSQAPEDQQQMIRELLGDDAEYRYELYFHWYNVLHELGHAVMMFNSPSRPHPAEEEQLVNNFAAAYWRHYGEAEKLAELGRLVDETLQKLPVPVQDGEDYLAYAKRVWGSDVFFTFNSYGWFQFSGVKAAIAREESLAQALAAMGVGEIVPQDAQTLCYAVCEQMSGQVVADAVQRIKSWGAALPEDAEVVFCDDVNRHMCQAIDLADGRIY